jgi:DNA-directed RNA polymerase specialized sigma54-like protein
LFLDGVLNVRTQGYQIERLEFYGDTARVRARHQYLDPWGVMNVNHHEYLLVQERRNYVIRQFGVSR